MQMSSILICLGIKKGVKGERKGYNIDLYSLSKWVKGTKKGIGILERCTNRELQMLTGLGNY